MNHLKNELSPVFTTAISIQGSGSDTLDLCQYCNSVEFVILGH